jgi:SMODS-associated and fused to various effectors sensor domain
LGGRLSNKIPLDLFQKHRDTQDWAWKKEGDSVEFEYVRLRDGSNLSDVALVLPLSGTIDHDRLPADIDATVTLYELRLRGREPGLDFLQRRETLRSFGLVYREFLAMLGSKHPKARRLHLFPAVPAPIAVLCGFERLPQVQPHLIIYNNDGPKKGFTRAMTVDDHECP